MALQKYTIKDLGISIEFSDDLPILEWQDLEMHGIYQPVDDGQAIVFIRYGKHETLENFVSFLGDAVNQVLAKPIEKIKYLGHIVQCQEFILFRSDDSIKNMDNFNKQKKNGGISHEINILVIGLYMFSKPILVGYRLPEELKVQYLSIFMKIVLSVQKI